MDRPPLEVADLICAAGDAFLERNRHWLRWKHIKVLLAIRRCRTAALGGHLDECTRCGHRAPISYNSCRNRHCPKCQTAARDRWIAARRRELLPTRYLHVVFTLPHRLAPLVLQNKKVLYGLLFRTSAETLLEVDQVALSDMFFCLGQVNIKQRQPILKGLQGKAAKDEPDAERAEAP